MANQKIDELQLLITANANQFHGELLGIRADLQALNRVAKDASIGGGKLFTSFTAANLAAGAIIGTFTKLAQVIQTILVNAFSAPTDIIGDSIVSTQRYENALIGLETVAGRTLGGEAMPKATQAARELASDGLIT